MPDPKADHHLGLYDKFKVERVDGSSRPGGKHEDCQYFVLDLDHDPYALVAIRAYATALEQTGQFPILKRDLIDTVLAKVLDGAKSARRARELDLKINR